MAEHSLADTVLVIVGLLFLASLAFLALQRINLPFTVGLVLLGLALRSAAPILPFPALTEFHVAPELIVFVLLPALLFEASFNMDSHRFMKDLGPILVLAILALLISAATVGVALHLLLGVPLVYMLLFGALISATDPVAVLAIFKELGAPKRLGMLVDGESLLNDGTALVLFKVLLGLALMGELTWNAIPQGFASFWWVFLGGTGLGVLAGWAFSHVIGWVDDEPLVEITLALVLAYGTFIVADHLFHVSGVMATVGAGLTLGNYGRTKISPKVLGHMEGLWEYGAFIANALVFLFMGLSMTLETMAEFSVPIFWAIVAVLAGRAVAIFLLIPLMNRMLRESISLPYQTIMWWGGLRGALAMAMALSLPEDFPARPLIVALSFGVVLFTLLAAAPSMRFLIRLLGLTSYSLQEAFEKQAGLLLSERMVEEKLADLQRHGMVSQKAADELAARFGEQRAQVRRQLLQFRESGLGLDVELRTLQSHCLLLERRFVDKLFAEGDLEERTLKDLHHRIQTRLDRIKWGGGGLDHEDLHRWDWSLSLSALARYFPPLRPLGTALRAQRLTWRYESERARLLAGRLVLDDLQEMAQAGAFLPPVISQVRETYHQQAQQSQHELDLMAEQFGEYVEKTQLIMARRFSLRTEVEALTELHLAGVIADRALKEVREEIHDEMIRLRRMPVEELLLPPDHLMLRVSFFGQLPPTVTGELIALLTPQFFDEGDVVVREGQRGDALYLIGRGVLQVSTGDVLIATLKAGDVFGEMALLTAEPRNATVTARTPCHLLELRKGDLEKLSRRTPVIEQALWAGFQDRVLPNVLAHIPGFHQRSDQEVQEAVRLFQRRAFQKDDVLASAGDGQGKAVLVVRSGRIKEVHGDKTVRLLAAGDYFVPGRSLQPASVVVMLLGEEPGEVFTASLEDLSPGT